MSARIRFESDLTGGLIARGPDDACLWWNGPDIGTVRFAINRTGGAWTRVTNPSYERAESAKAFKALATQFFTEGAR